MKQGWLILIAALVALVGLFFSIYVKTTNYAKIIVGVAAILLSFIFLFEAIRKSFGELITDLSDLAPHHYAVADITENLVKLTSDDGVVKFVNPAVINNNSIKRGNFVKVKTNKGFSSLQIIKDLDLIHSFYEKT